MIDLTHIGRLLVILGALIAAIGVLFLVASRIPWLGRLPGDLVIHKGRFTLYLPIVTSLILSLLLTIALRLFSRH